MRLQAWAFMLTRQGRASRRFFLASWVVALVSVAFTDGSLSAQRSERGGAENRGRLRVMMVDAATGKSVFARCYLTDAAGKPWSPTGAMTYAKPPEHHFIAPGGFEIALPPGGYTLVVERGPEYRAAKREVEIAWGEAREEKVALERWINMNERGWYSGDLHNHRDWREMPALLEAEDLNLAPTLTEWVWDGAHTSRAPAGEREAIRTAGENRAYSIFDTEIERLRDGPGAVDLVGVREPVPFRGTLLWPPNSLYAEAARRLGGYVDAEKITWRDVAALVALGHVDFAGIVHNHFNRHGVETATSEWGMIPKTRPEDDTPAGMPLWTMDVYYRFLNCGFRLPVSAGSASGVKASPLGYNRVYVRLAGKFGYREWFEALKAGRSFATNGPMLFFTVDGREPGEAISIPAGQSRRLKVRAEVETAGELDRLEILWKGKVVRAAKPEERRTKLEIELELDAAESGWLAARAFERPLERARFAHTSPVYIRAGKSAGVEPEAAKFFLQWIDREIRFYHTHTGFRTEAERGEMLDFFRSARDVYVRMPGTPRAERE